MQSFLGAAQPPSPHLALLRYFQIMSDRISLPSSVAVKLVRPRLNSPQQVVHERQVSRYSCVSACCRDLSIVAAIVPVGTGPIPATPADNPICDPVVYVTVRALVSQRGVKSVMEARGERH